MARARDDEPCPEPSVRDVHQIPINVLDLGASVGRDRARRTRRIWIFAKFGVTWFASAGSARDLQLDRVLRWWCWRVGVPVDVGWGIRDQARNAG